MRRFLEDSLVKWKSNNKRLPLIIQG
ncbi:MAG: hypothetical protein RLZZ414_1962, partial [Bacteroidota bacterium]